MSTLNAAQQAAVDCSRGPCLVLAGAGSGKTSVITAKITHLITACSLPADRILAVTFTNKAAAEMRERVRRSLGGERAAQVTICTFHALGLSFLREEHASAALRPHFTILDSHDQLKVLADVLREQFPSLPATSGELRRHQAAISMAKARLERPQAQARDLTQRLLCAYRDYLQICNAVDFDDLIYLPTLLLREQPQLQEKWAGRWRYVLVDEYQDTSLAQYALLTLMAARADGFTVVGDDDQSIYSWRGADAGNLEALQRDYPQLQVIRLEQNYRSAANILSCASSLIARNPHLFPKRVTSQLPAREKVRVVSCGDDEDEARFVARSLSARHAGSGCRWADCAVLFRSNGQAQVFERVLTEMGIPSAVSGADSFLDRAEVRDVLAYCRLLANRDDEPALLRIINVPRRGIGRDTLSRLNAFARDSGLSAFRAACHGRFTSALSPPAQRAVQDFTALIERLRQAIVFGGTAKREVVESIADEVGYTQYLRQLYPEDAAAQWRLRNVRTLLTWLGDLIEGRRGAEGITFRQAVNAVALREVQGRDERAADAVQLMTLHASKGLEFLHVYLCGAEEGTLPHRNALEDNLPQCLAEERRLAYVGMTRARHTLTITHRTFRRTSGARRGETGERTAAAAVRQAMEPSRFISELPGQELEHISSQQAAASAHPQGVRAALGARDALLQLVGAAGLPSRPR